MSSTTREYFDAMYAHSSDPWNFETSPYEKRKYGATMAALPRRRYANAFEPGCSIGVLTEMLAPRCERLLSTDIVPSAIRRAAERVKKFPHVRVGWCSISEEWPDDQYDLIVLSEIAYYFEEVNLRDIMSRVAESTLSGAHVVGVHWLGETDYPLSGLRTHEIINETECLERIVHTVDDEYVLDVWERST
jgi:predicted TPR repeat methyltransferase